DLGDLGQGIAGPDGASGSGYLIYSAESVHTRFSSAAPHPNNADHLITVRYSGGQWQYNNNSHNSWYTFTPESTDRLLASIDYTTDIMTSLEGQRSTVNGIEAGYDSGNIQFIGDWWNGGANDGEYSVVLAGGVDPNADEVQVDLVGSDSARTLEHKVANGVYRVTLTMGDAIARDNMQVRAEGTLVASDIDTAAGQYTETTFDVVVSDGSLSLEFSDNGGADTGWVLNGMTLEQVGVEIDTNQTAFAYDLGSIYSIVEPGFDRLTEQYTHASSDVRFTGGSVDDRDRFRYATLTDPQPQFQDFIFADSARTLEHKVANGTWRVTMAMVDSLAPNVVNNASVTAEGESIATGISTSIDSNGISEVAYVTRNGKSLVEQSFYVEVTDGSLSLDLDGNWRLASLELHKVDALPDTVTLQGEDFDTQANTAVDTTDSGYNGTGYINSGWNSWVQWDRVEGGTDGGEVLLTFRYANGSTSNRPADIIINGETVGTLDFEPTGGWGTWSTASLTAVLAPQANTIRMHSPQSGVNLDQMMIATAPPEATHQGEDATTQSGTTTSTTQPYYNGSGYVDFGTDSWVEWDAIQGGTAGGQAFLNLRYANGGTTNRDVDIIVNGVTTQTLSLAPTGGWSTWATATATADLLAGANTVRVHATQQGPHLDELSVAALPFLDDQTPVFNVSAEALSPTEARVTWAEFVPGETGFQVSASTDGGNTYTVIGTTEPGATSFLATGLTPGANTQFQVIGMIGGVALTAAQGAAAAVAMPAGDVNLQWYLVKLEQSSPTKGSAGYNDIGSNLQLQGNNTVNNAGGTWELVQADSKESAVYKAVTGHAHIESNDGNGSRIFNFGPDGAYKVQDNNGQYRIWLEDTFQWTNIDSDFNDWYWNVTVEDLQKPIVTIDDASAVEGQVATFTITMIGADLLAGPEDVAWETSEQDPVSAEEDTDYTGTNGTVLFDPGDGAVQTKTITVTTTQDGVIEPTEYYDIKLTPVSGSTSYEINDDTGLGTIFDLDIYSNVDIDVDSNNDDSIDDQDDPIEEDEPGKFIAVERSGGQYVGPRVEAQLSAITGGLDLNLDWTVRLSISDGADRVSIYSKESAEEAGDEAFVSEAEGLDFKEWDINNLPGSVWIEGKELGSAELFLELVGYSSGSPVSYYAQDLAMVTVMEVGDQDPPEQITYSSNRRVDVHGVPLPDPSPLGEGEGDRIPNMAFIDAYSLVPSFSTTDIAVPLPGGELLLEFRRTMGRGQEKVRIPEPPDYIKEFENFKWATGHMLGQAWSTNTGANIILIDQADYSLEDALEGEYRYQAIVTDETGNVFEYFSNDGVNFTADARHSFANAALRATLQKVGGDFIFEHTHGTTLRFEDFTNNRIKRDPDVESYEYYFRLNTVTDRNGNGLTLDYAADTAIFPSTSESYYNSSGLAILPTSIEDTQNSGRKITFTYALQDSSGYDQYRLIKATDPLSR
ncbi:MAG: carbohydrate-binding protein, partial [Planctomycetota bacterium]